jgi:hypothetical protein
MLVSFIIICCCCYCLQAWDYAIKESEVNIHAYSQSFNFYENLYILDGPISPGM